MKQIENLDYFNFFKEEIYSGFVKFLFNKLGSATVIALIGNDPVFSKKGVHLQLRRYFNEFLAKNPKIEKTFIQNDQKCYLLRNIEDGVLQFPIDTKDDSLMVKEYIRVPKLIRSTIEKSRVPKSIKKNIINDKTAPMTMSLSLKEEYFVFPKRLIIHFKKKLSSIFGKTTMTFMVKSKDEINYLIFDKYKDEVAFANCENVFKMDFVRRRTSRKHSHGKNKTKNIT